MLLVARCIVLLISLSCATVMAETIKLTPEEKVKIDEYVRAYLIHDGNRDMFIKNFKATPPGVKDRVDYALNESMAANARREIHDITHNPNNSTIPIIVIGTVAGIILLAGWRVKTLKSTGNSS